MITFTYNTDDGQVMATFNTVAEFLDFKTTLKNLQKKEADEKIQAALKEEEAAIRREQEEERRMKARWDALTNKAKDFVMTAKEWGVSPSGVVEILRGAILGAASDRCFGGISERDHEPESFLDEGCDKGCANSKSPDLPK